MFTINLSGVAAISANLSTPAAEMMVACVVTGDDGACDTATCVVDSAVR